MSAGHRFRDEWLVRAASTLPGVADRIPSFRDARKSSLHDAIVESGVAGAQALREAVRATHRVAPLTATAVDAPAAALVPERVCRRWRLVPVRLHDDTIEIGMENPLDIDALADVQAVSGRTPIPLFASAGQIDSLLSSANSPDRIVDALVERIDSKEVVEVVDDKDIGDAPLDPHGSIEKLVSALIAKAFAMRASDIHLEHDEHASAVRFRVDGVLRNILNLPRSVGAGAAVSRLKIMSDLDIADRLRPQDGRAKIRVGGVELGLRVSTLPTNFGEKVVIRLLDKRSAEVPFEKLGIRPDLAEKLGVASRSAQGLILVTGPTGSGKTTTLYSLLNRLKNEDTNIVTVEDPVEYKLEGINQTQVQEKQGLTFAAVLRSVLRQDPDVILVGEIRDQETAETAMQAALTGHLVVSSLHTNDAVSTITRLTDIGVQGYKLAPAILAITAQRLVRTLCPKCRKPVEPVDPSLAAAQRARGIEAKQFAPTGCVDCGFLGYKGRTSLVEMLVATDALRQKIAAGASADELRDFALAEKSLSPLIDDALWRLGRGDTSLDEVRPYVSFAEAPARPSVPPEYGASPAKGDDRARPAPAAPLGGRPRVLVADDDPTIRIIVRTVLEASGCAVQEAEDGAKALAAVAAAAPDLLIADLNMPGLDGYGLVRGVRESLGLARLPIIVLTADSDDKSQEQAFALGADDYLIKPVKAPLVAARVKAAFRRLSA